MALDFYDALRSIAENRKSTRHFSDREVSAEDIGKILSITSTSPYGSGRRNWEIVTVTDRQEIVDLAHEIREYVKTLDIRDDFREQFSRAHPYCSFLCSGFRYRCRRWFKNRQKS
jgi:nitroreductase